jgi:hypothetical protein
MRFVTVDRFADRLDAATYEGDDDTVGIWERSRGDTDALWLSGRLFRRLTTVAAAYELHTLPMLGGTDPEELNKVRCESLMEELAFVAERLIDPLAARTAQAITDYVAQRVRGPLWEGSITIEGD